MSGKPGNREQAKVTQNRLRSKAASRARLQISEVKKAGEALGRGSCGHPGLIGREPRLDWKRTGHICRRTRKNLGEIFKMQA